LRPRQHSPRDLYRVAGEPPNSVSPAFERVRLLIIIIIIIIIILLLLLFDLGGPGEEDVDVAVGICLATGERTEDDHADRRSRERSGQSPRLMEHGVGRTSQGEEDSGGHVLGLEREQGHGKGTPFARRHRALGGRISSLACVLVLDLDTAPWSW
jgi:hypothetical protein